MAFTFNPGDLVQIAAGNPGAAGLYIVLSVSGSNLVVYAAESQNPKAEVGFTIPQSRVTSHWASA